MEAIVLAGGLGTRLRSVVSELPKPMAPIGGTPFLNVILRQLSTHKINKVILSTGYKHEKIYDYYGDRFQNMELVYSLEPEPLGTGGAIRKAMELVENQQVFILNGDTFFDIDLLTLMENHIRTLADLTLSLKPMKNFERYGIVELLGDKVTGFHDKIYRDSGLINGGIYAAKRALFDGVVINSKFSFEDDFMQQQTSEINMHGFVADKYFIDIGIPEDYKRAQSELGPYEK